MTLISETFQITNSAAAPHIRYPDRVPEHQRRPSDIE